MMLDYQRAPSRSHSVVRQRAELSKSTAISDSDNWTGAPAAEDDGSLDDIPSSTDAFTAAGPGPSIAASDWLPQLTP